MATTLSRTSSSSHPFSLILPLSRFPNPVAGVVPYDSTVSPSLGVPDGAVDDFSSSRLACILPCHLTSQFPPSMMIRVGHGAGSSFLHRHRAVAHRSAPRPWSFSFTVSPFATPALISPVLDTSATSHSSCSSILLIPALLSSVVIDAKTNTPTHPAGLLTACLKRIDSLRAT